MHISSLRVLHLLLIPLLLFVLAGSSLAVTLPQSLLEPAQLKKWIDNGYRTEKGERVVIINVVPNPSDQFSWFAGDVDKLKEMVSARFGDRSPQYHLIVQLATKGELGHIPGSLYLTSHAGGEVADRSEGPMLTEHQIADGARIDAMLQKLGVTKDDVLVLASPQQNPWMVCAPRLWWSLYYWGFSPEKLRLLDGSTKGYADAGYPLQKGVEQPAVTPSHFSVAQLPTRRLNIRVGLEEMISLVDSGKTSRGDVYLLDARQPPVAYYLKDERTANGAAGSDGIPDIYQVPGFSYNPKGKLFTRTSDKTVFTLSQMFFSPTSNDGKAPRAPFNMVANPPIPLPNPWVAIHSTPSEQHFAIPLCVKGSSFEGIIKGAHLVKDPRYNITVPALVGPDNRYKSKAELLKLFAMAGIDGKKPVILYCNTGAVSSFYFYAMHEICGFKDVRMYDGSWVEWGDLTAFEPADTTYVRSDVEMVYPAYPAMVPGIAFFDGKNNYLEWDGNRLVDAVTGKPASALQVKPGGTLKGNPKWDTVHRSEHVVFRASQKIQDPKKYKTYNSDTDWPEVDTVPDYSGKASKIKDEDAECCI
jgi:3-mercaptopyruvate sulfurtransferase SseA